MKHLVKLIPTAAAIMVGVASFVLSFVALRDVAAAVGAVPANLAWLVPIVVDGGVLAGSASLWASSYRQTRRDPVAYLTVAGLLAFSVVVNINHAGEGLLAKSIAALPPIVLLACLELVAAAHRREYAEHASLDVISQTQQLPTPHSPTAQVAHPSPEVSYQAAAAHSPQYGTHSQTPGVQATSPHPVPDVVGAARVPTTAAAQPRQQGPSLKSETAGPSKAEQVREAYDLMVLAGEDPSDPRLIKDLAEEVGVSETYVRRLIRPMRETRVKAQAPTG